MGKCSKIWTEGEEEDMGDGWVDELAVEDSNGWNGWRMNSQIMGGWTKGCNGWTGGRMEEWVIEEVDDRWINSKLGRYVMYE